MDSRRRRGRAPKVADVLAHGEMALTVLAAVASGRLRASTHDRIAAARELADRAFGRPAAPVPVSDDLCVLRIVTEGADPEPVARVTETTDGAGRIVRVLWPASMPPYLPSRSTPP